ncbi:hypothetical protein HYX70_02140 [Candidatus Saccharibacteria bacterium]|nr:hypothetical protein [Candidatus Saccharibacteria bacterium]
MKHIILYSHGFGVRKDDRGQFTDIASALPDCEHVMFEYNDFDEDSNTMTTTPIDVQAEMLKGKFNELANNNPDANIDLIYHSQGCVAAALSGIPARKTVFITPPQVVSSNRAKKWKDRQGATVESDGSIIAPRRDGTKTKITPEFISSVRGLGLEKLYNDLSNKTTLYVFIANNDDVLGKTEFDNLKADIRHLPGDHNFSGDDRAAMVKAVKEIISE